MQYVSPSILYYACSTCVASRCAYLSPSCFIFKEASESVRRLIRFLHWKEGFYVGSFYLEPAITIFDPHPSHYEACWAYIISCVDREEPTTENIARESEWSTCRVGRLGFGWFLRIFRQEMIPGACWRFLNSLFLNVCPSSFKLCISITWVIDSPFIVPSPS